MLCRYLIQVCYFTVTLTSITVTVKPPINKGHSEIMTKCMLVYNNFNSLTSELNISKIIIKINVNIQFLDLCLCYSSVLLTDTLCVVEINNYRVI